MFNHSTKTLNQINADGKKWRHKSCGFQCAFKLHSCAEMYGNYNFYLIFFLNHKYFHHEFTFLNTLLVISNISTVTHVCSSNTGLCRVGIMPHVRCSTTEDKPYKGVKKKLKQEIKEQTQIQHHGEDRPPRQPSNPWTVPLRGDKDYCCLCSASKLSVPSTEEIAGPQILSNSCSPSLRICWILSRWRGLVSVVIKDLKVSTSLYFQNNRISFFAQRRPQDRRWGCVLCDVPGITTSGAGLIWTLKICEKNENI